MRTYTRPAELKIRQDGYMQEKCKFAEKRKWKKNVCKIIVKFINKNFFLTNVYFIFVVPDYKIRQGRCEKIF